MKKILKFLGTILVTFVFIKNVNAETEIKKLGYVIKELGVFDVFGINDTSNYSTSYGNYGYYTKLVIDDKEVDLFNSWELAMSEDDLKYLTLTENEIIYDKPDFAKLEINLNNIDDQTVVATYKLTNKTDKKVSYKLGTTTDVDFAGNDEAAIMKDNVSFIITQDYASLSAYKAQLNLNMSPDPSTTYIGPYYEETSDEELYYYAHIFDHGETDFYTAADYVDTALAYSWQNELEAGETKTYTATFRLGEAKEINLNFYHLNIDGTYGEAEVISTLGGGQTKLAEITNSEQGYNYKWYKNSDGTGKGYYSEQIIVAPTSETDFYEVKKSNSVVEPTEIEINNYGDAKIDSSDLEEVLLPQFKEDLNSGYDDISILLEVEDISELIEQEEKNLIESKISEDYEMGVYFDARLYKIVTDETNETDITPITETDKPIKILFKLPEAMRCQDQTIERLYQVLRLHDGVVDVIDATYNEEENTLLFETDRFSTYALTYKDVPKNITPAPEDDLDIIPTEDPETIDIIPTENPETLDNINIYISIGIASLIILTKMVVVNKKHI